MDMPLSFTTRSHDVERLALDVARRGHSQGRRHGRAGVTGPEVIVFTLHATQESRETVFLPQAGQPIVAAGENLPGIPLVSHIPQDLVFGGIEGVEQRDRQLNHAETGADVAARLRHHVDEPLPHLFRQLGQLLATETLDVFRTADRLEERHSAGFAFRLLGAPVHDEIGEPLEQRGIYPASPQ
jgi:hypothetical protein